MQYKKNVKRHKVPELKANIWFCQTVKQSNQDIQYTIIHL